MTRIWIVAAAAVLCGTGAQAQAVYKCNPHTYSEQPCSKRIVRTYEAPVPASPKPRDVVAHRLPGETMAEFNTRKRRAGLTETDRDECARLDKRIPVDEARVKSLSEEEVDDGQAALVESHRRFRQLHC
jgi:hypothetical protein